MRRRLLIIVLGIAFLILITLGGTLLTEILPHRPTARVQTAQAGPYQVTLQVDPNPPQISEQATLSLRIVSNSTQQLVTNARVTLESTMETMDMGTERVEAQAQSPGAYLARVQFPMSGPWQVRVTISTPGASTESTTFEVMAQ